MRIGFVILSHNNPQQLRRLVLCLQQAYDNPPIAIHHDFGQSSLRQEDFPSDVQFVAPHLKTRWGKFSLVAAALRALELLYQKGRARLVFPAECRRLSYDAGRKGRSRSWHASGMDALLDYREVPNFSDPRHEIRYRLSIEKYSASLVSSRFDPAFPVPENPTLKHFIISKNLELAWRRYIGC